MKLFLFTAFLFGICSCQQSTIFGTMHAIPAKIHYEIFGSNVRRSSPITDLLRFNPRTYLATPLLTQKRGPFAGFNGPAYDFGHYQIPRSNNTQTTNKIPLATELFAPAIVKFPAATKGQIDNYMKALQKEAEDGEKEIAQMIGDLQKDGSSTVDSKAVSYVSVRLGGTQNVNYHYASA